MASTYLSYTQGTPTNNLKWTVSMWVKRSDVIDEDAQYLLTAYVDGTNHWVMRFIENKIDIYDYVSGSQSGKLRTNRVFRDPAAWYHIVYVYDSANAAATDRMRLYVNGVEETSFTTDTQPAQNTACIFNLSGRVGELGRRSDGGAETYFDGSMAHVHFCDGQAYAASDFGETDATSGIWVAKTSPSVTYGDNGFFLKFASGAQGTDSSGEENDFTVSGTATNTEDTPSNNFATMNPLDNYYSDATFSYGNNKVVSPGDRHDFNVSTLAMNVGNGKFYSEFKLITAAGAAHCVVGISDHGYQGSNEELSQENYSYAYVNDGQFRANGSYVTTGQATYTVGDIIGVAFDTENLKLYFSKNGVWQDSGDPTSGSTGTGAVSVHNIDTSPNSSSRGQGTYFFALGNWHSLGASAWESNFGNGYFGTTAISSEGTNASGIGKFEYDVPTGYTALSTKGLNE